MTPTPGDTKRRRTPAWPRATSSTKEPVREVCPYLEAANGGWRSVQPTREHRCTATAPASPLALSKQRELCLLPTHLGCATYQAAREVATESRAGADGGLWPETRGAVLSLEPVRAGLAGVPGTAGRGSGQAILVALMVVAFLLLAITRVAPPSSGEPPASSDVRVVGSGDPAASAVPATAAPTATVAPSPSPQSSSATSASGDPASAAPSADPSAGASPSAAATTYRVKGGDTLSGIAARFGVTVRDLRAANALGASGIIHPGQVLVIPG
jgi:LysM repeat protein